MRARIPIIPPTSNSTTIVLSVRIGSPPSAAAGILSKRSGVSDRVTASATNSRICAGIWLFEKPGASIRQAPMRQNSTKAPIAALRRQRVRRRRDGLEHQGGHEMVPSDLTSKPRAISSCDSTGSVGNMRSMIMRT